MNCVRECACASPFGEAWALFCSFYKNQGVHFSISLQISGGEGETAEFTDFYAFRFRFGLKKVAVEK